MNRVEKSLLAARTRLEDQRDAINVKFAALTKELERIDRALDALKAE